ncbi:MAG: TusE/DsrC/DsvC family sulfur relay protein [Cellvibrionales bacterium TMED148]|nr:sulfurtransferase TusE [Porticoccaceae bacterium]RPG88861.1 MAG: TusE/DsrC/DsvC family sulfur relay protein [Cellvibrionales bacterium TMED148]
MVVSQENSYIATLKNWDESVARARAKAWGITLTDSHLEILYTARHFYSIYGFSPSMRPLTKFVSESLQADKGRSIYLVMLFPGSSATLIADIAGIPKPKNCL